MVPRSAWGCPPEWPSGRDTRALDGDSACAALAGGVRPSHLYRSTEPGPGDGDRACLVWVAETLRVTARVGNQMGTLEGRRPRGWGVQRRRLHPGGLLPRFLLQWLVSPLECPCLLGVPVQLRSLAWGLADQQARVPSSWGHSQERPAERRGAGTQLPPQEAALGLGFPVERQSHTRGSHLFPLGTSGASELTAVPPGSGLEASGRTWTRVCGRLGHGGREPLVT